MENDAGAGGHTQAVQPGVTSPTRNPGCVRADHKRRTSARARERVAHTENTACRTRSHSRRLHSRSFAQPFTHRRVEHTGGAAPAWHCSGLRQLARKGRARVRRAPPLCAGKQRRAVKGRRATEEEASRNAVGDNHARASGFRCGHRRQGPTGQGAPGSVAYRDANGCSRQPDRGHGRATPGAPSSQAGDSDTCCHQGCERGRPRRKC